MIASWMLLGLVLGLLLLGAGLLLEGACRAAGWPRRWVWGGALAALAVLVVLAPLRRTPSADPILLPPVVEAAAPGASPAAPAPAGVLHRVRAAAEAPLRAAARVDRSPAAPALGAAWLVLSAVLAGAVLATLGRARRARRGWALREVAGTPVRVSPSTGPAVLGVRRPEVVVPAWLLEADPDHQRVVVLHEREHVRAGDPLLLALGILLVVFVPWNPFAWAMLRRLRLAVEVDCDRRVLRGGIRSALYGSVLLDLAGRGPGLTMGAPAMAGSASNLERRLRAMTHPLPRFGAVRSAALGVLGLAALVAACETRMPTTAEVEAMDVAAAESHARGILLRGEGDAIYYVNGRQVTAEEARALTAGQVARITVRRGGDGPGEVHIVTGEAASAEGEGLLVPHDGSVAFRARGDSATHGGTRVLIRGSREGGPLSLTNDFDGLIIIDGVIATPQQLRALTPDRIERVEVIKGAAARTRFADPRAEHGVIQIVTRGAGSR